MPGRSLASRRRVLLAALVALLAASLPAPAAADPGDNLGPHWRVTGRYRTVVVVDRTSAPWDGAVRAAAASWSRADPAIDFAVSEGAVDGGTCSAVPGAIVVCSGVYGGAYHGLTEPAYGKDGHVTGAVVRLDETFYAPDAYPWPATPEREALAAHELGHSLGLDHGTVPYDGCLAEVRDYAATNPGAQDVAKLTAFAKHNHPKGKPDDGTRSRRGRR